VKKKRREREKLVRERKEVEDKRKHDEEFKQQQGVIKLELL
jgi:hypothetical protein